MTAQLKRDIAPLWLLSLGLIWSGCTYTSESLDSLRCEQEGKQDGDRRCQGGIWVFAAAEDLGPDADQGPVDQPKDMPDMCIPQDAQRRCQQAGFNCGTHSLSDGCGAMISTSCGTCADPQTCAQGQCVGPETDAQLCARLNKNCGMLTAMDNVGVERTVGCGTCTDPETCTAENVCACEPETSATFCMRLGKTCGLVTDADNCGQPRTDIDCGTCAQGNCKADNTCTVCEAETDAAFCLRLGKNCGMVTGADNCEKSRTVSCGTCTDDKVCGADNSCACPTVQCPANAECGSASNACGNNASCGMCAQGQTCTNFKCVCAPETDAAFCARLGKTCGSVTGTDNCGAPRTANNCGTCPATTMCQADNTCASCTPERDATICAAQGSVCGPLMAVDNCQQSRNIASCGACATGVSCVSGQCKLTTIENPAPQNDALFGASVAMFNDLLVVGSPGSSVTTPSTINKAGLVHVYRAVNDVWTLEQTLQASDPQSGANFGTSVSIYNNTLIIGAPLWNDGTKADAGKAYVFTRSNNSWSESYNIKGLNEDDKLGTAVAIVGNNFAIGIPGGDIGGTDRGLVLGYRCSNFSNVSNCTRSSLFMPNAQNGDAFGSSLSLNTAYLLAGAPRSTSLANRRSGAGSVALFDNDTSWPALYRIEPSPDTPLQYMGTSVALMNSQIFAGADFNGLGVGIAYTFAFTAPMSAPALTTTALTAPLMGATGDRAGEAVAANASFVFVGAPTDNGQGKVHLIARSGAQMTYDHALTSPASTPAKEYFGASLATANSYLAIGAPQREAATGAGRVYVYKLN